MAESPVLTLVRLLGGVVLMRGRLGHQILGEMLVMGSNEVAVAGAAAVVAATSRQRNAVAQMALRTAVPALAVRGLLQKQEKRIAWKERLVAERERRVEERERELDRAAVPEEHTRFEGAAARIMALEEENRQLQGERERLSMRVRSLEADARNVSAVKHRRVAFRALRRRSD